MFTTFLASLAVLTLRADALTTITDALAAPSTCDTCGGRGEFGHGPDCVSCGSCDGHGERLTSAWDADRDAAHRAVLAATLVDRSSLPAARAHARALAASFEMTARRALERGHAPLLRGCPNCHEVRDLRAFEDDGLCEHCHIDFGALEADLERWPNLPPSTRWKRDTDPTSQVFAEVA